MSISLKALRRVRKSLPHLRLCKDFLVVPPSEHFVRGYVFERTPYKGMFCLWRVVMPLFSPPRPWTAGQVVLEYSRRIPNGDQMELSREEPGRTAAFATNIISDDLPHLDKVRTPEGFLDYAGATIDSTTPRRLVDYALSYYLIGRTDRAIEFLEKLVSEMGYATNPEAARNPSSMEVLLRQMRSDPGSVAERIRSWEQENIEQLGLSATVSQRLALDGSDSPRETAPNRLA